MPLEAGQTIAKGAAILQVAAGVEEAGDALRVGLGWIEMADGGPDSGGIGSSVSAAEEGIPRAVLVTRSLVLDVRSARSKL